MCVEGASFHFEGFGATFEPWRSFEELWRSFEVLKAIWSLEVHKCLIGALWRYLEALNVHVCTFQHCKS